MLELDDNDEELRPAGFSKLEKLKFQGAAEA
jgi:hypothetical protein